MHSVGCILSAVVAVSPATHPPPPTRAPCHTCPPAMHAPHKACPRSHPHHACLHPTHTPPACMPLWTEFLTHATIAGGKNSYLLLIVLGKCCGA